ncbi:MAG: calcineurin-like phosphoesterase C-terminal domain-containing protein [Gammaproteobacteria bacterium]
MKKLITGVAGALLITAGGYAQPAGAADTIDGIVFEDSNRDGQRQAGEPGISGVLVSDGHDVVVSGANGEYALPAPTAEEEAAGISIFVTKPAGWEVLLDQDNIPLFFHHHKPGGSPPNVRGEAFRFGGLEPTGPLPETIDFPLIRGQDRSRFKVVVSGDPQPYSNTEVGYVRDTLAKELAAMDDVQALVIEGDIMGDDLGLYPRFKRIMSVANTPQYYVPGNHDLDFDAPSDEHSFDTFKREWGPTYYSFDIGQVHFVVLDDLKYPCTPVEDNLDGLHDFCDNPDTEPTYNGIIDQRQLEWLRNDLANVPLDKLVVLNSHISIHSFVDHDNVQHAIDNARALYDILGCQQNGGPCERKVLALSGHTHTLEQIRPGESFEGWNTTLSSGGVHESPGPAPFPQIVTGAAAGAWWGGDFDAHVIPESWQRLGAPRGYMIFEFDGNEYTDTFKATGKPIEEQMSLSMLSPTFLDWYRTLRGWLDSNPPNEATPPVNINDLPDTQQVLTSEIASTSLVANVWNGSRDSEVTLQIDGHAPLAMTRTQPGTGEGILETLDPFSLMRQLMVARYAFVSGSGDPRAQGFERFRASQFGPADPRPVSAGDLTDQSNHVWTAPLPADLEQGVHVARVVTKDVHGQQFEELLVFEVVDERPPAFFRTELFRQTP